MQIKTSVFSERKTDDEQNSRKKIAKVPRILNGILCSCYLKIFHGSAQARRFTDYVSKKHIKTILDLGTKSRLVCQLLSGAIRGKSPLCRNVTNYILEVHSSNLKLLCQ